MSETTEQKNAQAVLNMQVRIEKLQAELAKLSKIRGVSFQWQVIAQERLEELDKHKQRVSELTKECLDVETDVSNCYKRIKELEAKIDKKDELIFAYDAVRSPVIETTIIDLRARIEEIEAEMDSWNLSTKNIDTEISFEKECKRLRAENADLRKAMEE